MDTRTCPPILPSVAVCLSGEPNMLTRLQSIASHGKASILALVLPSLETKNNFHLNGLH
jgi:hypothetical protein